MIFKNCVTALRSLLGRDDSRFAADSGVRKRAIEGAARFFQASALKTKIELFSLIAAGAAQGGIMGVIEAHQQEQLHGKTGVALGDVETLTGDQLG